jgi:uncharacterized Zn finger protein (UPF0148 family)
MQKSKTSHYCPVIRNKGDIMMEQENKQQAANQAGPSSAAPETQQGLQEHLQSGEKIIEGARTDDQLQRLKEAAQDDPATPSKL